MTILFISLALAMMVAVAVFARLTTQRVETLGSVAELGIGVDVVALKRLLDPDDDRFIRENLPRPAYRRIRRRRDRLVLSYVRVMMHNTSIVMAFASSVRQHCEAQVDHVAAEVVYTAMRVRLRLAAVAFRTALDWAFPIFPFSLELTQPYRQLQDRAALLFRLLDPGNSGQALAAL
jgi:hypothetical protein